MNKILKRLFKSSKVKNYYIAVLAIFLGTISLTSSAEKLETHTQKNLEKKVRVMSNVGLAMPTVLATRGKLIIDDHGSGDRGGELIRDLGNGVGLKTVLGIWERSENDSKVWRSTWVDGHPPVASYKGVHANNLIVEITFRYGEVVDPSQSQFMRIAADQRPQINGHIVSAWSNPNSDYTKTGFLLEHVSAKTDQNDDNSRKIILDHQPLISDANTWYTAILEIVGDEALFRMGNHIAYAKSDKITIPKNMVSITLGTTWHEIKRVRIWHAEANPDWKSARKDVIGSRKRQ